MKIFLQWKFPDLQYYILSSYAKSYQTTPMQLTYGQQHSTVISLQVYEPF